MKTLWFGRKWQWFLASLLLVELAAGGANPAPPAPLPFSVGVAKANITPAYPIRLTGYVVRKTEMEGVEQALWAKALAIALGTNPPVVLVTVDNCGLGAKMVEALAATLKAKAGLERERLAVCSTHTHAGPCTVGFAPNIFAQDLAAGQLAAIERYTRELATKLENLVLEATRQRRSARLAWCQGQVNFAANRRTPGGPVDHFLPLLCAFDDQGKPLALLLNYACHCTTLGGQFNKCHGDWAGCAQEFLERDYPGSVALVTIGCGADANPSPRDGADGGLQLAKAHGHALAAEVERRLAGPMTPLSGAPVGRFRRIALPFQPLFAKEELTARAQKPGVVGYHARKNLDRLARGESLPATVSYPVQSWVFGEELALVFLGGEVVVDYALQLRQQFDARRLWLNAYANDVCCYIPSRRILQEGGYEAEDSMWYYDQPNKLSPETEDLVLEAVGELLPTVFRRAPAPEGQR